MPFSKNDLERIRIALGLSEAAEPPSSLLIEMARRAISRQPVRCLEAVEYSRRIERKCGSSLAARWAIYDLIDSGKIYYRFERNSNRKAAVLFRGAIRGTSVGSYGTHRLILNSGPFGTDHRQFERIAAMPTTDLEEVLDPSVVEAASDSQEVFDLPVLETASDSQEIFDPPVVETATSSARPKDGPYPPIAESPNQGEVLWPGKAPVKVFDQQWRLVSYLWGKAEVQLQDVGKAVWNRKGITGDEVRPLVSKLHLRLRPLELPFRWRVRSKLKIIERQDLKT